VETDSSFDTVTTRSLKNSDLIRVYLETIYTVYICGLWCHDVGSIQRIRQSLNQPYRIQLYSTKLDLLEGASVQG